MQGLIGRKIGMTRIFDEETGRVVPVTVVETGSNVVHQVKTVKRDGYSAVQLGFDVCSEASVTGPEAGHVRKHNSVPTRITREFALDSSDEELVCGQKVGVEVLDDVRYVDVVGTSKGRGFTGTVKRFGFHIGRRSHGNTNKRARGSLGAGTYPARVFPGLKMAGRHGGGRVTAKGIQVVGTDKDSGLLYLKGSIPGCRKGIVFIRKNSVKG